MSCGSNDRRRTAVKAKEFMAHSNSHWGDEDREHHDDDDPEDQEELFETAKHLGWTPDDMQDRVAVIDRVAHDA